MLALQVKMDPMPNFHFFVQEARAFFRHAGIDSADSELLLQEARERQRDYAERHGHATLQARPPAAPAARSLPARLDEQRILRFRGDEAASPPAPTRPSPERVPRSFSVRPGVDPQPSMSKPAAAPPARYSAPEPTMSRSAHSVSHQSVGDGGDDDGAFVLNGEGVDSDVELAHDSAAGASSSLKRGRDADSARSETSAVGSSGGLASLPQCRKCKIVMDDKKKHYQSD